MPKMKTKKSAAKRFKVNGSGKILFKQAGKRHGMTKRSNKFIRQSRPLETLDDGDVKIVKQYLPYAF